ncbi:hypothetical protein [Colwellia sp. UCD-KL20]|uniref:hypothetical protein n=1 Tax=Colwellia sp. UCD-KL20 TaxID=1917165 RepID=UPI000971039E|nr:hypothetical protein [Colwellia sp. UCD-KL20]
MHVDKAKKRIAKLVKAGFKGYPQIALEYFGESADCATLVVVQFTLEEGAKAQEEQFSSKDDARESEVIQSALVKIIERANAKTVLEVSGVSSL